MLVAFSGGPDSVGLALALRDLGYEPYLAYVNHNLRGAFSLQEAQWVREFAQQWAFPLQVLELSPDRLRGERGIQAAARQARYAWMEQLLNERAIAWGATAHTWEDQMETFLYRFVRGGIEWDWRGIPYRRGRWLRPLLYTTRQEIILYLQAQGAAYFLDHTNYMPKYLRNQVRWCALPPLYRLNPDLRTSWLYRWRLAQAQRRHLLRLYAQWEAQAFLSRPYGEILVRSLPIDAFYHILRRRWTLTSESLKRLWRLWHSNRSGALYESNATIYVRTPQGIERGEKSLWKPAWEPLELSAEPGQWTWGLWHIETGTGEGPPDSIMWDKVKLNFPLRVRLWQVGDRLAPAGLKGYTKKLSDIWQEVGLYGFERRHAFVIEDSRGNLIGAVGYRPSYDTIPTASTAETFYLRARYGGALSAFSPTSQP
ncbi:MAG: tRNA lysidine(34) synthetase TilS [Bacteroidia bacterium]|nr:tRNA lysidine(34) synthetase TilS [Bacteroidia bacterium]